MRNLTTKLKSGLQIPTAFLFSFEVKIAHSNTKQTMVPAPSPEISLADCSILSELCNARAHLAHRTYKKGGDAWKYLSSGNVKMKTDTHILKSTIANTFWPHSWRSVAKKSFFRNEELVQNCSARASESHCSLCSSCSLSPERLRVWSLTHILHHSRWVSAVYWLSAQSIIGSV